MGVDLRMTGCHCHGMAKTPTVGDQPVNVRLPKDMHQAMIDLAAKNDRALAAEIRMALRSWIDGHTKIEHVL